MKLSLAWIFDHIQGAWRDVDVKHLASRLNAVTTEIEGVSHISLDPDLFTLVRVLEVAAQGVSVESLELKKKYMFAERKDTVIGNYYVAKKEGRSFRWALLSDLGSTREELVPAVWCPDELIKGAWKETVEWVDYRIALDNIAITHRPDLWSHRGFAREIAAILDKQLIAEEFFLVSKPIKHYTHTAPVTAHNPFTLEIMQQHNAPCGQPCKRLAGLYISSVGYRPSFLPIVFRFARIDARPLHALVDATNYVMFDIGQPMHAFDAATITTQSVIGRCAHEGETLTVLDGDTVQLTSLDYVLTDGEKPLSLAGIIGGLATRVMPHTHELFIVSENLDPVTIRRTSQRIKKRTESSARFEKSLDPNQNTYALLRFLKLLQDMRIPYEAADAIASIGPLVQERILQVAHEFIEKKIGIHVSPDRVEHILVKLGFGIQVRYEDDALCYAVTVPTYRATKDITIAEDIVEEVARFLGYDTFPHYMPMRSTAPFDTSSLRRLRSIKQHLAYTLSMHELQSYALYDEEFLKLIQYDPSDALRIANPLSEHWQRLATSLVPHMLKAVYLNHTKQETLRFFECNRVWFMQDHPVEAQELAGICYEQKQPIDFYTGKAWLSSLFTLMKLPASWVKAQGDIEPWYMPYQTADIIYDSTIVGRAGMSNPSFLGQLVPGNAFIFELNSSFLLYAPPHEGRFEPLAKYPEVHNDISMLVSQDVTYDTLASLIGVVDPRITQIELIDFYEKEAWHGQKSLTVRLTLYDPAKTLTGEEIDHIMYKVVTKLQNYGVTIR